jgi:peptide/nickel transport system ATP-binding protein
VLDAPRDAYTRALLAARPRPAAAIGQGTARPGSAAAIGQGTARPGSAAAIGQGTARPGSTEAIERGTARPGSTAAIEQGAVRPGSAAMIEGGAPAVRLEVTGLVARHGGRKALHEVSLRVAAGECLAVVGRSGSGKTTLARCLAGLHLPDSGSVRLGGRELARTLRRRTRADLAAVQYVFQDARASFDPNSPVLDQVARTAVRLRGMSTPQATAAALETLDEVALPSGTARRRPGDLSGGELQRAALARALLAEPAVLICDEITSGLDTLTQATVLHHLQRLARRRRLTLVVISHDLGVVAQLADHVAVLADGRLVEYGPAAHVLADGQSAGYGPAAHVLADGRLAGYGPATHVLTTFEEEPTS